MEDMGQMSTAVALKQQEMEGFFRMQECMGAVLAEKSWAWGAVPEGFVALSWSLKSRSKFG